MKTIIEKYSNNRSNINLWILQIIIITYVMGWMLLTNILIGLMFLHTILNPDKTLVIKGLKDIRVWCIMLIFFLTLIGVFYSSDQGEGWKFVERRLAFILIPLPVYTLNFNISHFHTVLKTFVAVVIGAAVYGLVISLKLFMATGDSMYFYNNWIVEFIDNQAVYFSIYVNLSICIICYFWFNGLLNKRAYKLVAIGTLAFLILFNYLLASRVSIIIIYFIGGVYLVYWMIIKRKLLLGITIFLAGIIIIVGLVYAMPKTFKRFKSITNTEFNFENERGENHFNQELSDENWNGLTLRLAIWTCTYEIIRDNMLIGVGTGDYKDQLFNKYKEKGFNYGIKMNYGSHSMYLYVWMTFGLIGLILFLVSLILPIISAIKQRNALYVIFIFLIMVAFLTENVLNRYVGIVFFPLMSSLLLFQPITNKD